RRRAAAAPGRAPGRADDRPGRARGGHAGGRPGGAGTADGSGLAPPAVAGISARRGRTAIITGKRAPARRHGNTRGPPDALLLADDHAWRGGFGVENRPGGHASGG